MISRDPAQPPSDAAARPRSRRQLRSVPEIRARRQRIFTVAVFACSFMLMVNALVGENGYLATVQAQREYAEVTAALAARREANRRLADEIRGLRQDPRYLEEAARRQLGLIKPGETLVIIRDTRATAGTVQK